VVRRPDRAKLCSSVSVRFAQDLEKNFMPDVLSNVMLLDTFGLFEFFCWGIEAMHFRAQANELTRRDRSGLALTFSEFAAVVLIILWKFWVKITRVLEIQSVHHVGIQIVTPDFAKQAVCIGEQKCTAICIFGLVVVVVKRIHDKF